MKTNDNQSCNANSSQTLLIWGIIIFLVLTIVVIAMPWLLTHFSFLDLGVEKSNEIGDTIGGIMGPTVGLMGAALTFLAFWAQFDANKEQRRQFKETLETQKIAEQEQKARYEKEQAELRTRYETEQKKQTATFLTQRQQFEESQQLQQEQIVLQDKRMRIDLFENKLYTMLSIHRDNVNNMDLNTTKGRKVFLLMFNELRFIYWMMKKFYEVSPDVASPKRNLSNDEIYQVAYLTFFFGIGENSTPLIEDLGGIALKDFIANSHNYIHVQIAAWNNANSKFEIKTDTKTLIWDKSHTLGVGHLRRLSHYIRHLFQMVKFVDDQPSSLLNDIQKYNYITNIRAQLSVHEQILLYYNALSVLGQPWLAAEGNNSENYIIKYCMIKSIPLNSADFYRSPQDVFPRTNLSGKPMFEWIEIKERILNLVNV
jgi:hypothetical protein